VDGRLCPLLPHGGGDLPDLFPRGRKLKKKKKKKLSADLMDLMKVNAPYF
jgi:hypothetical protein